jgi:ComF family protein
MMKKLKNLLLDILFPVECLGCRQPGFLLCERCFRTLEFNGPEKSFALSLSALDKIFIAGDYDQALLARLIKKFKYDFLSGLGAVLARWLIFFWSGQSALFPIGTPEQILVIPIPLSKKRLRWRGFNQAEILARPLCDAFGYCLSLDLKRTEHIKPQAELSGKERLANIRGAFRWTGPSLAGRTIILIDDVVTTGATLGEAAGVLRRAGAERIYGLVLAKG